MIRVALASTLAGALCLLALDARADQTLDDCVDGFEQAQRLRLDGKLVEAREKLLVCSRPVCPKVTQPDCARWLGEVEARLPTVIVRARAADGNDLDDVATSIDGRKVAERLDGRPRFVDPGPHVFRFEIDGGTRYVEQRVVLLEGEKDRRLSAEFARASPPPPSPGVSATAETTSTPDEGRRAGGRLPSESWILGGVSVLALTSFVGFGLSGKSSEGCVPNCARTEVDDFRRAYLIADLSLGVALVTGGLAVFFALTKPPPVPQAEARP